MNIKELFQYFAANGCNKIYVKSLSSNDNSKQQVYVGGGFDVLNIFTKYEIKADNEGNRKRESYKTKIDFSWLQEDGQTCVAPQAQFILYPDYPEVRFSGFLKGCKNGPSDLMTNKMPGRLLFLGLDDQRRIIGYVVTPDSEIAADFNKMTDLPVNGVFREIILKGNVIHGDTRTDLMKELTRIINLGWINSKRLDAGGLVLPCNSPNCGGYTLEAELGIIPNGIARPDFLDWEIKQFSVRNFKKCDVSIITLLTPEPTHGYYTEPGVEAFLDEYGY